MAAIEFSKTFKSLTGNDPFPWQQDLYEQWFSLGKFPASCNLPTGLGKTSVIAVWLIALANGAAVPRRLVYVVNRRTVVDQTTDEVEKYKKNNVAGIPPFAISTLRGQFADNREWSADPSRPAVICGTVDMIGSRLLFSGYGIGFKQRPLHAGFVGQDSLLVHDEAHLEPAFQCLIKSIEKEQRDGERAEALPWPKLRVMELTATSRGDGDTFGLTPEEKNIPNMVPEHPAEPIHRVWQRMKSKKGLKFHLAKRDSVATTIGEKALERGKNSGEAILIFVSAIDDVKDVKAALTDKKKGGVPEEQVRQLTGTMRGFERDKLATQDVVFARFCPSPKVDGLKETVYLICTSAGEVGIDISAHHMVCDLSTLDSMAQRFGRVNRRGEGAAMIDVVYETDPNPKPPSTAREMARWKTKELLERLPRCAWTGAEDRHDASPQQLGALFTDKDEEKRKEKQAERDAAFAPTPTILPVTDILFDGWALTTIRERLPGRPKVEPYLHGLAAWEPPETQVAWRAEVYRLQPDYANEQDRKDRETADRKAMAKLAGDLLDDYPLKPHELLREPSYRAFKEFGAMAKRCPDLPVWLLDDDGEVEVLTVGELADKDEKERIEGKTVLLPPSAGGLEGGMLNGSASAAREGSLDVADDLYAPGTEGTQLRIRVEFEHDERAKGMRLIREVELPTSGGADEEADVWFWYSRENEGEKSTPKPVKWCVHVKDVVDRTKDILANLPLSDGLKKAVTVAADLHDHGKRRKLFQLVLGNVKYPEIALAKSGGASGTRIAETYRHEFGSLLDVCKESSFQGLPEEGKELVLHLIATHHGRARPHFPADEVFDPERSQKDAESMAISVPRRFARLQRRYGRWGLAYLESLLRAADWAASAKPSKYWEEEK